MARNWQKRLASQMIRSLDEHPNEWVFQGNDYARNDHLKLTIWYDRTPMSLRIVWKGGEIIKKERGWFRWCPHWRCRLLASVKRARKFSDMAKLFVIVGDTLSPEDRNPLSLEVMRAIAWLRAAHWPR